MRRRRKGKKRKKRTSETAALRWAVGRRADKGPARWNPEPEDVQRSVVRLVLSLVEFLRQLLERQTLRRMEARTLTAREVESLGVSLMHLERTVRDIAARFDLDPSDLDLDLGPLGRLTGNRR